MSGSKTREKSWRCCLEMYLEHTMYVKDTCRCKTHCDCSFMHWLRCHLVNAAKWHSFRSFYQSCSCCHFFLLHLCPPCLWPQSLKPLFNLRSRATLTALDWLLAIDAQGEPHCLTRLQLSPTGSPMWEAVQGGGGTGENWHFHASHCPH